MFLKDAFENAAPEIIQRFKEAIRSKPIPRKSAYKGEFSAVANASGRLAESAEVIIDDYSLKLIAFDYWQTLAYGRAPGSVPNVDSIQEWIINKNLDLNANSTALNIGFFGTTIWQKFQGANSGIFSEVVNESIIEMISDRLIFDYVNDVTQTLPSKL